MTHLQAASYPKPCPRLNPWLVAIERRVQDHYLPTGRRWRRSGRGSEALPSDLLPFRGEESFQGRQGDIAAGMLHSWPLRGKSRTASRPLVTCRSTCSRPPVSVAVDMWISPAHRLYLRLMLCVRGNACAMSHV